MDLFKHVTGTTTLPLPLCLLCSAEAMKLFPDFEAANLINCGTHCDQVFNTTGSDMTFQARQPGLLVHTDCDM